MITKYFPIFILILVSSCIGTDVVEYQVDEVLIISQRADSIKIGDSFLFEADYYNSKGEKTEADINWMSTNSNIISIDIQGNATAISEGKVFIIATYKELMDSAMVVAGDRTIASSSERTGDLMGFNDYDVKGGMTLYQDNGDLILRLEEDFEATNGPGLHVYLSNQLTGVAGGVDLGELRLNRGEQEYIVPGGVLLNTYNNVIIYCKPFGVVFGNGEFDN